MVTTKVDAKNQVDYYMSLPYTMIVKHREEQGGYYVASYVELPDLNMTGATPEEAVKELLLEKPEWFETCLELGISIPLPIEPQKYSGKIVLRIPATIHEALIRIANMEGVSLNQFMATALSRAIGLEEGKQTGARKTRTKAR